MQCANNQPTFDAFSSLGPFVLNEMVAAGAHDVQLRKPDFDATALGSVLSQIKRATVMCDTEPDQIWTLADYVANFGRRLGDEWAKTVVKVVEKPEPSEETVGDA